MPLAALFLLLSIQIILIISCLADEANRRAGLLEFEGLNMRPLVHP